MLVLQRKVGEQIRIGQDIVVTVLKTACGKVRLGVQAPKGYRIRRSELLTLLSATAPQSSPPAL